MQTCPTGKVVFSPESSRLRQIEINDFCKCSAFDLDSLVFALCLYNDHRLISGLFFFIQSENKFRLTVSGVQTSQGFDFQWKLKYLGDDFPHDEHSRDFAFRSESWGFNWVGAGRHRWSSETGFRIKATGIRTHSVSLSDTTANTCLSIMTFISRPTWPVCNWVIDIYQL